MANPTALAKLQVATYAFVTDVVADRIYEEEAPSGVSQPNVVIYDMSPSSYTDSLVMRNPLIQISVYSKDRDEAKAILTQLVAAMGDASWTQSGIWVRSTHAGDRTTRTHGWWNASVDLHLRYLN